MPLVLSCDYLWWSCLFEFRAAPEFSEDRCGSNVSTANTSASAAHVRATVLSIAQRGPIEPRYEKQLEMEVSPSKGCLFGSPKNKGYSILGFFGPSRILGHYQTASTPACLP